MGLRPQTVPPRVTVKAWHSEDEIKKIAGTGDRYEYRVRLEAGPDPVNWRSGLFANDWATAYDVYFAIRLTTVS